MCNHFFETLIIILIVTMLCLYVYVKQNTFYENLEVLDED